MAIIVIFASSLFLASVLVFTKALELKFNRKNFALKLLGKLDEKAFAANLKIKFLGLQIIQSARYVVLVKTPQFFRKLASDAGTKILIAYKEREGMIMGKRNITSRGSVSFFLKKIDEGRGNSQGKIEESL